MYSTYFPYTSAFSIESTYRVNVLGQDVVHWRLGHIANLMSYSIPFTLS